MTTPISQVAINAAAARWLTDHLDRWGLTDTTNRAEWVCNELLALGLRPVPKPYPLRPSTSASTKAGRAAARALYEQMRDEAKTAKETSA